MFDTPRGCRGEKCQWHFARQSAGQAMLVTAQLRAGRRSVESLPALGTSYTNFSCRGIFIFSSKVYTILTMQSQELTKVSMDTLSDGYWSVCNSDEGFDRDVYTVDDMQLKQRGNCFTLSEFLCNKFADMDGVVASGVCIEVLPNRRNYHAVTWAVLNNDRVYRFDLLKPYPTVQPNLRKVNHKLRLLADSSCEVLYASISSLTVVTAMQSISLPYEWPTYETYHEAIYINAPLGIQTLHTLAELGGTKRLLETDSYTVEDSLPVLPM